MNTNRTTLAAILLTLLGGCQFNQLSGYSETESPKHLTLDTSITRFDMRFAGAVLAPADAARLRNLAATGAIGPADRVLVAAAGNPSLADARVGSIAGVLLPYGVIATASPVVGVQPNRAIIEVSRTLVTLPHCPNWSKSSAAAADYTNQPSSNFGCANTVNLGLMVANPTDLVSGRPVGPAEGRPEAAAVNRYLNDKVQLPAASGASPFSAGAGTTPAAPTPTGSQ
jgi:pilus assembly protein CpaD